jgi:sulfatase maturation enzyme AslB (radical SAM superfamily)
MSVVMFVKSFNCAHSTSQPQDEGDLLFDVRDFAPSLHTRLPILQPTPFCNIDGDYCYLPNRDSTAHMSLETVRLAAERLVDDSLLGESLPVLWHAGEPLVLPPDDDDQALTTVAPVVDSRCEASKSMQTNGVLTNDAWYELFVRRRICVGVSVDGLADLHDRCCKTRNGKGTHAAVVRGMELLRRRGTPFHAIGVVTSASFERADDLFEFFASGRLFITARLPAMQAASTLATAVVERQRTSYMKTAVSPAQKLFISAPCSSARSI